MEHPSYKMADISWIISNSHRELYAKAEALEVSAITLSSEIAARTFVATKERATPGEFTLISSYPFE